MIYVAHYRLGPEEGGTREKHLLRVYEVPEARAPGVALAILRIRGVRAAPDEEYLAASFSRPS